MMANCWRKLIASLGILLMIFVITLAQENSTTENPSPEKSTYHNPFPAFIVTPKPVLTGNPRIDYIHDPNLPRELDGVDLSNYPFYQRVPKVKFNFTCDGRLDGFYASIPHECQVYHNCLFGVRYDFLCPNYTAFDQTNFICHYINQVDCKNSEIYYVRNELLYVEASTTTAAPIIKIVYVDRPRPNRRRPTTAAPAYYDDYYDYDDAPKSTTSTTVKPRISRPRKRPNRPRGRPRPAEESRIKNNEEIPSNLSSIPDYDFEEVQIKRKPDGRNPQRRRRRKKKKKKITTTTTTTTTTAAPEYEYEYYDYYYDDETAPQATTTSTTTRAPQLRNRRPLSRPTARERQQQLKIRRQQLIDGNSRKSVTPVEVVKPEVTYEYYDDVAPAKDTQPEADIDYEVIVEPVRIRGQNARRPALFHRGRQNAQ